MISNWISSYGSVAVFFLVALESIGIPVPGETAVISASMYAGLTHNIDLEILIFAAGLGAIIGGIAGWGIGKWFGYTGLKKHGDKIGVTSKRLAIGRLLFKKHGRKIIFFSRFAAFLRSIATLLAGANGMSIKRFLPTHISSSLLWAVSYCTAFYFFGKQIQQFEHNHHNLTYLVISIIGCIAVTGIFVAHKLVKKYENSLGKTA